MAERRGKHHREQLERVQILDLEAVGLLGHDLDQADGHPDVAKRDDDHRAGAVRGLLDPRVVLGVHAERGVVVLERPAGERPILGQAVAYAARRVATRCS